MRTMSLVNRYRYTCRVFSAQWPLLCAAIDDFLQIRLTDEDLAQHDLGHRPIVIQIPHCGNRTLGKLGRLAHGKKILGAVRERC